MNGTEYDSLRLKSPNMPLGVVGHFTGFITHADGSVEELDFHNDVTDVGKNKMLDCMFNASSQSSNWYIGLIDAAGYTAVASSDTYGTHTGWTENVGYSQSTRPAWSKGAAATKTVTNATVVTFTMNATSTIKGVFISNNNVKADVTSSNLLWSTGLFGADRSFVSGDTLTIIYSSSIL